MFDFRESLAETHTAHPSAESVGRTGSEYLKKKDSAALINLEIGGEAENPFTQKRASDQNANIQLIYEDAEQDIESPNFHPTAY